MTDNQRISLGNLNSARFIAFAMMLSVSVSSCSRLPAFSDSNERQDEVSAGGRVADLETEVSELRDEIARLRGSSGSATISPAGDDRGTQVQAPVNLNVPAASATPPSLPGAISSVAGETGTDLITGSVGSAATAPGRWAGEIPVSRGQSRAALELDRPRNDAFALQLGAFAHEQNLKPARAFVLAAHGDLLSDLRFRSELISLAGKRYYNLVAGPLGTESESAAVCREIENRGGFCKVAKFKGAPLD